MICGRVRVFAIIRPVVYIFTAFATTVLIFGGEGAVAICPERFSVGKKNFIVVGI